MNKKLTVKVDDVSLNKEKKTVEVLSKLVSISASVSETIALVMAYMSGDNNPEIQDLVQYDENGRIYAESWVFLEHEYYYNLEENILKISYR